MKLTSVSFDKSLVTERGLTELQYEKENKFHICCSEVKLHRSLVFSSKLYILSVTYIIFFTCIINVIFDKH